MSEKIALDGTGKRIALGGGYSLRAQGLQGSAKLERLEPKTTRGLTFSTPGLDKALSAAGIEQVGTVRLDVAPVSIPKYELPLRDARGADALVLEVPDLGPEVGQTVLSFDESGVATWHFAVGGAASDAPAVRGRGAVKQFYITRFVPPHLSPETGARRGLVSMLGSKLLKVLVYPITDPLFGPIGAGFAERWESVKRPYALCLLREDLSVLNSADQLSSSAWERLSKGRALLFVHGSLMTVQGTFGELPRETLVSLNKLYGERIFGFNHFTLAHDVPANVHWLLKALPQDITLELDIICHGRGGLLSRELAEQSGKLGEELLSRVRVRRVIFVGTPNNGTPLADPDLIPDLVDRMTTVVNLLPSGNVVEALEGIFALVKIIGHGLTKTLPGFAAMKPGGAFLQALNSAKKASAQYHAVTADFRTQDPGLLAFLKQALVTAVRDSVFKEKLNDLIVPMAGVFEAGSSANFPIPENRRLVFQAEDGVMHTAYFQQRRTSEAILNWLSS